MATSRITTPATCRREDSSALPQALDSSVPAIDRRKVYDTTQPGRGNGGHTFGDDLTEEERMAVIEYLKTL